MSSVAILNGRPYYYLVTVYYLKTKKNIYTEYIERKISSGRVRDVCFSHD